MRELLYLRKCISMFPSFRNFCFKFKLNKKFKVWNVLKQGHRHIIKISKFHYFILKVESYTDV